MGLLISTAGSQMQFWALLWHISQLTDQPIALSGIGLARIIPVIIFSLVGGAAADALNRRTLLLATQTLMAFTSLTLAVLTFSGKIALWQIYVLTALNAFAIAFDNPARQSLVPNLVPGRDLPNAFSMTSIAFQTGSILGPALSGFVISYFGQGYTYLINAFSYGAVLIALLLIGNIPQQRILEKRAVVSVGAIREGIDFILHQPIILSTMLLDFLATFFSSANTLLPYFSQDILKISVLQYGWLSAAQSVGAVAAALVVSQLKEIRRQGPIFLWSVVAFGLATVLFGLSRTFTVAFIALALIGASDSVSMVIRNTIRQIQTPDYIRGRMTGINQIFFMGGPQLGEIEAGLVAQFFGLPAAIISGGLGCLAAVGWVAKRWPVLRRYNGDEPVAAGVPAD
jgi:MFS family permease